MPHDTASRTLARLRIGPDADHGAWSSRRSVCWPSPIGIVARTAPNRGFCAGLLRLESAAVGSRTGAVAPELLLIAGTGLPAAMFREGFRYVIRRRATGVRAGALLTTARCGTTPGQARTAHGATTPRATSRQAPARLRGCVRRDRRP